MGSKTRLAKFEEAAVVELGNLSLAKVDFFDLFGLQHDLSPKSGCNGPSLSQWLYLIREDGEQKERGKKKKKTVPRHKNELKASLDSRHYHLVEYPKLDRQRLLRLNNAREYFKVDCALRFRCWATKSSRTDGSENWRHCYSRNCDRTTPTREDSIEKEAAQEPVSKLGEPGEEAGALADDVIIISSDDSFQAKTSHERNLGEKLLLCLCQRSFQDVQSLLDHGRLCEEVPDSARAKGDRVRQNECVYDCVMKDRTKRSWKHRNRTHYACQNCGEIATQQHGHHFSSPKPIDPVCYFLQPKKEFQKQRPGQVIEKAFKSMSPCEAKDLDELDDAQLVSIFRSRLKQRAALAFASLDSPVVMNEGLGSPQGAPDTILDPGNETENRNNPVPFLESNARASPIQQGPWSAAHSPAVAQSDCTIFEQVESVDRTPASSAVEPPSPSFSLPGDGQVNLDSGSASPPEDDAQDPSFGPSTCEDEGSQPLYSRNDGLSNGSDAPPDQARPDTISYVERLPSSVAARTTTDPSHGKPIETSKDGIANPAKRKRKGDSQVNKATGMRKRCRSKTIVLRENYRSSRYGRIPTPQSPSPPRDLLIAEHLLHSIKAYFTKSCQNMRFDMDQSLVTPTGDRLDNALCSEFDSYCFTATVLAQKRLSVEFRRALSKACDLVKRILQAQHPRTLACFLEVFIHLIQSGHSKVAISLCGFVAEMSKVIGKEGGPLGTIYELLGKLDEASFYQALAPIWRCISDTFDTELGQSHRLAVSIRLDYIKRVVTDHKEEETLLTGLLGQFSDSPQLSTPRVMLNLAHNLNKQGCHDRAEDMASKVSSLLQTNVMYTSRVIEKIECLKVISRSQFHQGKTIAAKQTMREAIQMIEAALGKEHPWVTEFKSVLEGWLRDSGQEQEANVLREEIHTLIDEAGIDWGEQDKQHDGI